MQIRLWGTPEENQEMIELLRNDLENKIKIISTPYRSANSVTQRVYVEIDFENKNYRKHAIDKIPSASKDIQ